MGGKYACMLVFASFTFAAAREDQTLNQQDPNFADLAKGMLQEE
jgi:hypothetical protein